MRGVLWTPKCLWCLYIVESLSIFLSICFVCVIIEKCFWGSRQAEEGKREEVCG